MKKVLALTLLTLNLLGCIPQPIQTTPTESPATVTEAPPTSTPVTPTLTQPPSPTQTQPTAITVPSLEQIVYYYFVNPKEAAFPAGSIIVMPEAYILAPILSGAALAPEADANLRSALEAALKDSRNSWISNKLEIVKVAFGNGRAEVVLQGEYFGVGDVTLFAASQQILLTVFANANVRTATVTLNGDTIGNMGISISLNAKPANYVFTRIEIETYMNEHAYSLP